MSTKTICIIGASGVIGSAVARALDNQGFQLGLHYCNNIEVCELILSPLQYGRTYYTIVMYNQLSHAYTDIACIKFGPVEQ